MARKSKRKPASKRNRNPAVSASGDAPSPSPKTSADAPPPTAPPKTAVRPGTISKPRPSGPSEPIPLWKNPRLQGITLFVLTLLVYIPAFAAGFTWDDDITLTKNALVQLPEGLRYIWASKEATDYYPLTWTTFWIEWRLWGPSPYGYHAVNVLLHALSSVLLWRIFLKLRIPGAWIAALLFAVHPFCVDSVVWISQRKNVLCMAFFFTAILAYLKHDNKEGRTWLGWAILSFAAALLSKASVIGLPMILLTLTWFRHGSLGKRNILDLIPFFALALASALVTLWFQGKVLGFDAADGYRAAQTISAALQSSNNAEVDLSFFQRILVTGHVFWFYVLKIIFPAGIAMIYPKWDPATAPFPFLPFSLMIAAVGAAWFSRKRIGRGLFTGLAYLGFALFPVLGLFTMSYHYYSYVSNHLGYLAVPGVVALVVGYAAVGLPRLAKNSPHAPAILGALVFALFAWQTASRASLYWSPSPLMSTSRLWADNIKKVPDAPGAWNEYGIALGSQDNWKDARDAFRESIKRDKRFSKPWNNLGTAYARLDDNENALAAFKQATVINPLEFDAWGNMGTIYLRLGQLEEAIIALDHTIKIRPMSPASFHNKGLALAQLGRNEEATANLLRATEMNSSNPIFHAELGLHFQRINDRKHALTHLLRAIDLGPVMPSAYNVAAWIMATNNDPTLRNGEKALAIAQLGLQTTGPGHLGLVVTKAAALAELGRFDEAVTVLTQALPLAESQNNPAILQRLHDDISRYQSRHPMRED